MAVFILFGLKPGANIDGIEKKLTQIIKKHPFDLYDPDAFRIKLQSISELHYDDFRGAYRGKDCYPAQIPSMPTFSSVLACSSCPSPV